MNKKISTLLAGVMLASAFSVNAAMENGKSYLLGTGANTYLSANVDKNSGDYGQLLNGGLNKTSLAQVVAGTWKVTTKTTAGAIVYTFTNKVTGTTLSIDPSTATKEGATTTANNVSLAGGSVSEWAINSGILMSYFKTDSVYFLKSSANKVQLYKGTVADATANGLGVTEDDMANQSVALSANDLNTLLRSVDSNTNFFELNMDPEVSEGKANHLSATGLHAIPLATGQENIPGYVTLQAKDKKNAKNEQLYVVVDTAYYEGTEISGQLLKYTYDKLNADNRKPGSYQFKFTYNVKNDLLYIQVKEAVDKITKNPGESDEAFKAAIIANNNSYWTGSRAASRVSDQYIYMAKLDGTYVLTLNKTAVPAAKDQNIKINTSANYSSLTLTTLPEGVYLIQYKSTGANKPEQNNAFAIANLKGRNFGWIAQERNQDFKHMPAAQWVVKKKGTSSIAPVAITNREFDDATQSQSIVPGTAQLFAVKGDDNAVFYFKSSGVKDTVSFIKLDEELAKDTKLGYKYVDENDAKVQTFVFNYLHGLAEDKYLNTPSDNDSIVRVDETGEKANFRLKLVVKDDKYGYEDGLVRNVYHITDSKGRYLSYDYDKKKYMMKNYSTPYFLKENNCKDGAPYYTLVEADITYVYDKDGNIYPVVNDGKTSAYDENGVEQDFNINSRSYDYADIKVSVDDNTLDLTRGDINDKIMDGSFENRTSAFAVAMDDSPLYRRFNNVALGESATDGPDSLTFVESVRNEYLMDEWNSNLTDKTVDYVGIWSKGKADGKLAFRIDTAWVNRGLGNIKPQYLISVDRHDQEGIETIDCTEAGPHVDKDGKITEDPSKCVHAQHGRDGFAYGKYLVNFSDSAQAFIDRKATANPYMFTTSTSANSSYTRVGFVKAIHAGDSLFVLTNGFEKMDPSKLDTATIIANYKNAKLENFIVDLVGDKHKNVTWSFRYINPDNAGTVTEEGTDNAFLFESNVYFLGDANSSRETYRTVKGDADRAIAPTYAAAWLKMHNGCLVLTDAASQFSSAKTNGDGALIFNVGQKADADDMVTSNDQVAVEGVSVVAGNGTVTVQGAAGKSVVINNILGKVVAETVLTSDNAVISVPAGIVAVAVEGEEAVKVIVK